MADWPELVRLMQDKYIPIHCDLHDYIEIMCTYALDTRVCTVDGELNIVGVTTETDKDKQEWLLYQSEGETHKLRLDDIVSIHPLSAAAPMGDVYFK